MPASPLEALPSETSSRATSILVSRSSSRASGVASGHAARWTESARGHPSVLGRGDRRGTGRAARAGPRSSSAHRGASPGPPASRSAGRMGSVRQKRRRDLRTYQFERSSTSRPIAEAAGSGSYPSSDAVACAVVASSLERIQRSSTGAVGGPGDCRVERVESVERRVRHEEAERVPELERACLASPSRSRRTRPAWASMASPARTSTSAARPPLGVEDLPGVEDVAQRLGHLAPVLVDDVPEAQDVAVGRRAEHERVDRKQRVEPAARLVDRLADEVRRESKARSGAVDMRIAPWAAGIDPESNQASITGRTRVAVAPQCGQAKVTSSIAGRCGSTSTTSRPAARKARRASRCT